MKQILTKNLIADFISESHLCNHTKSQLIDAINKLSLKKYVDWEVTHTLSNVKIYGQSISSVKIDLLKSLIRFHSKGYIIEGAPNKTLSILRKIENLTVLNKIKPDDINGIYSLKDHKFESNKLLAIYQDTNRGKFLDFEIYEGNNDYLYEIMLSFCISGYISLPWRPDGNYPGIKYLTTNIELGLKKRINKITDIDDDVISKIIQHISILDEEISLKINAIKTLLKFIDYLEDFYPQTKKLFHLYNKKVRNKDHLPFLLANNFIFCSYPIDDELIQKEEKFVIYLQNLNRFSNKYEEISLIKTDFSKSALYKKELKNYVLKNSPLRLSDGTLSGTVIALNTLREVKIKIGTIQQKSVSIEDCVFFIQEIKDSRNSIATKNDLIGYLRRFLEYVDHNKLIQVEKGFKEQLKQIGEPPSSKKRSINKNHLTLVENLLLKNAAKSSKEALIYVAFELMLKTEMRPNQIMHIKKSKIQLNEKNNTVTIQSISKTSKGKEITYSYGIKILKLIKICIKNSDKNSDYLFGFSNQGSSNCLSMQSFNYHIKQLCEQLNIPIITPIRLRDTYMTAVVKYAVKNNLTDIQIKALTGHSRLRTTLTNYVDEDDFLISYLERTYQIEIGKEQIEDIRPDLHIKQNVDISSENLKKENTVGNECGICSLSDGSACKSSHGGYSCLICKKFITTLEHKDYFEKAIDSLSLQIKKSKDIHEKEELTAIKTICGIYLHEIIKRGIHNDNNAN